MKSILTALLVLFLAVGAKAQNPIKVVVSPPDTDAQKITDRLKAKIGRASRYALSDSAAASLGAPLLLTLHCIPLHPEGGSFTGYACDSVVTYFPDIPNMGALSVHLDVADTLVSCPTDGEYCAEAIFEGFVNGTQPETLATAKSDLERNIDQYIRLRDAMNQLRQQSKQPQK